MSNNTLFVIPEVQDSRLDSLNWVQISEITDCAKFMINSALLLAGVVPILDCISDEFPALVKEYGTEFQRLSNEIERLGHQEPLNLDELYAMVIKTDRLLDLVMAVFKNVPGEYDWTTTKSVWNNERNYKYGRIYNRIFMESFKVESAKDDLERLANCIERIIAA